jgi:hypothetical protein
MRDGSKRVSKLASQRVSGTALVGCFGAVFWRKAGFSGDFPRPNLMMREDLGAKSFQQALISKGLKIICKV